MVQMSRAQRAWITCILSKTAHKGTIVDLERSVKALTRLLLSTYCVLGGIARWPISKCVYDVLEGSIEGL